MAWKCHFRGQRTKDMIILTPDSYLAQKITLEMGSESIKVGQMCLQIEKN